MFPFPRRKDKVGERKGRKMGGQKRSPSERRGQSDSGANKRQSGSACVLGIPEELAGDNTDAVLMCLR